MNEPPDIEWDENKRALVFNTRGLDIAVDSLDVLQDPAAKIFYSPRNGEDRFLAVGLFGGKIHAVAYTHRGSRLRIITMRRAGDKEEEAYRDH
jgi:uncharacterized DUF497 family protein